jgi:hypothetical protein
MNQLNPLKQWLYMLQGELERINEDVYDDSKEEIQRRLRVVINNVGVLHKEV